MAPYGTDAREGKSGRGNRIANSSGRSNFNSSRNSIYSSVGQKRPMSNQSVKRVLLGSTIVTAVAVAASVLIMTTLYPAIGGVATSKTWLMSVICPLLIGYPCSAFVFLQSERLRATHAALLAAHRALGEAHEKLAHKASRDEMTGMLNRESFFEALEAARRHTRHGALLIVDADHFKNINDSHGHLTGDAALRNLSAAIAQAVRSGDILGRIGGEEFGVFMPGAGLEDVSQVAERVRAGVAAIRFRTGGGVTIPLTVSIGIGVNRRGMPLSDLLREADGRLYEAKRRGRNRVVADGALRAVA